MPPEIRNLILDYSASMEEYELRKDVMRELVYKHFFNKIYKVYCVFLNFALT